MGVHTGPRPCQVWLRPVPGPLWLCLRPVLCPRGTPRPPPQALLALFLSAQDGAVRPTPPSLSRPPSPQLWKPPAILGAFFSVTRIDSSNAVTFLLNVSHMSLALKKK